MSLFPGWFSEKDYEACAWFCTALSTWLVMFIVGDGEKAYMISLSF